MRIALPLIVSLGMFTTMIALSLGIGSMLPPDRSLPLPFGSPGVAASKTFLLSVIPVATAIVTAGFAVACKTGGRSARHPERYVVLWLAAVLLLAIGHGLVIRSALISLQ